ncbi:Nucleic acid-binding, OB-fold [Sesbania bispinosa]|nr:Nucleic acid-binding, OB-fold [Sesbania bispinosa]
MTSPSTREIKVKDISSEIDNWVIKVKVLLSWPNFDSTNTDDMLSLEVVLIDSEGTKIHGSIAIEVLCATSFNLNEGGYYEIGRVEVVENDGLQRITDHPFRLVFWNKSFVKPWEPAPFSSFGLSPFTASEITTYKNELNQLIDTIALCTSISLERFHVIDNRVVKMILLELTDHAGQIECVLYDEYVDQLHDYLKSNGTSVVQVIPTVTKLVFNPPIVEVFHLYDCFLKHGVELLTQMEYVRRDQCNVKLVDDFILSYPRRTIRKLCLNSDVGCYVILDTITAMVGNEDWLHLYSSAIPKANEKSEFGVSPFDGYLIPRYNVKADVFDGVESKGFYLDDHHVINYLTKFSSQTNITMLNALKKICPVEDSSLKSDKAVGTSSVCSDGAATAADVETSSSSMGLAETSIVTNFDCEFCDSEYEIGLPKK